MTTRRRVQRERELQRDLRDNALYYADSGERLAEYAAQLAIQAAMTAALLAGKRRLRGETGVAYDNLMETILDGQRALAPFRGRICLCAFDDIYDIIMGPRDDDGGGDGDDDAEAPNDPTPVPAVFSEVFG